MLVWWKEGEEGAGPRVDDDRAVDGGAGPVAVGVPPDGSFFVGKVDLVGEFSSRFDRALSYVGGSV